MHPRPPDPVAEPDAADRLILDHAHEFLDQTMAVAVIGDPVVELTLALEGRRDVRVHQDLLRDERALTDRIAHLGYENITAHPLDRSLVEGAGLVLLRLPKSLDRLRDVAGLIAAHAAPGVVVVAGGRIKHMTTAMNDVLREFFDRVDVTHARQKSRVLIATGPHDGADPLPRSKIHPLPGIGDVTVCAMGGVFAGTGIDIGTRFLLENLPERIEGDGIVDLACGSGVVATVLALQHPDRTVIACDQSAAATQSTLATAAANGVRDRIDVRRDDALSLLADGSVSFVALNPPFHEGSSVDEQIAPRLFADAARALRPGGELWTVWNSHLDNRAQLDRLVGSTRQVARNAKFTITSSRARAKR